MGLEWSEVRLSEMKKKREKTHQYGGENGSAARRSVGWSSDWHRRTTEALSLSLSHRLVGWSSDLLWFRVKREG